VRYIQKSAEPKALGLFAAALSRGNDLECDLYGTYIDGDTREAIINACLVDQQGLCAYTGMTAAVGNFHVEHLVPRSASYPNDPPEGFIPRPFETIEWTNLVACIPMNPSGWPYGAGKKDKWPSDSERHLFVSPVHPSCETRFKYGKRGSIQPANVADEAAIKTIEHLGLDHDWLNDSRKAVLEVDRRITDPAKRRRLVAALADRSTTQAMEYAFQRWQVLKREWAWSLRT
jgi:uncharacterized protein (TIGR02646 family)